MDSSALDHMIWDASLFDKYNPCSENLNICIIDGSLKKVARTTSIIVSKDLTLEAILLLQNLDCNLLFISKLIIDLNYVTKFFSNMCEY